MKREIAAIDRLEGALNEMELGLRVLRAQIPDDADRGAHFDTLDLVWIRLKEQRQIAEDAHEEMSRQARRAEAA
ncbi:hypothetical protein [Ferruginivarius sediminum]|uniref:Uncharacterized protein n=1 Tax=Ferruginivarius sediminum TaxID=2661937 RepID=A0A369TLN3_9PROT|nr:hypothetical protein [Ferruginivarius sediminum]RDD63816.1 hypothetical protein DRB17_01215 [Ferruginivarius sediminum]